VTGASGLYLSHTTTKPKHVTSTEPKSGSTSSGFCLGSCNTPKTTTPAPTPTQSVTPTPVPQTSENNSSLNAECANAQFAYDNASGEVDNATNSALDNIKSQGLPISLEVEEENQVYGTSNASLSQDYSAYLSAVNAIPGCAVDFQYIAYPTLPNP